MHDFDVGVFLVDDGGEAFRHVKHYRLFVGELSYAAIVLASVAWVEHEGEGMRRNGHGKERRDRQNPVFNNSAEHFVQNYA